jgi:hypothetical protein
MNDTLQTPTPDDRIDIRNVDGHESWQGLYDLLEAEASFELSEYDAETLAAAIRRDRPERYRRKHRRGVTS